MDPLKSPHMVDHQVDRSPDPLPHDETPGTLGTPTLSIIVPTYKEKDNIEALVNRAFEALRAERIDAEMIFVDDNSQDGSADLVEKVKKDFPVQMIVRLEERGLSTAVLRGFEEARGDCFLVMDADLSHPPEKVPELYRAVAEGQADFVIGSRYVAGGRTTEDWSLLRKINSVGATLLARPLTSAKDPMAGFFCLRRQTWQRADALNPLGYKIGLELLIKGGCRRVTEVPIVFQDRHAGESKMTVKQQLLYVLHLKRLYAYKFPVTSFLLLYILPVALVGAIMWVIWA